MNAALLLFDIDGTLLISGGATSRCMERAGRMVFGDGFEWAVITPGLIDPQLLTIQLEANELPVERLDEYAQCYLGELEKELVERRSDMKLMPGVAELLQTLRSRYRSQKDVVVGLLTGNYRRASIAKLEAAGLDPAWFTVSAFADDGHQRSDLPGVAMSRCRAVVGTSIGASRTIIIGDTPRDVQCARDTGCVALAVATGRYSVEQLQESRPDTVVADLSDPDPLFKLIECSGLRQDIHR